MPEFWQEFLKYLGSATIIGLLVWLSKLLIDKAVSHRFNLELEKHKVQLKAESEKEIESLKSQLQLLNQQQIIRFSAIHEKKAEIVQKFYPYLNVAFAAAKLFKLLYVSNEQASLDERTKEFTVRRDLQHAIWSLEGLLGPNKLVLGEKTSQNILTIITQLNGYLTIHDKIMVQSSPQRPEYLQIWNDLEKEAEESRAALESEFCKIIGSEA